MKRYIKSSRNSFADPEYKAGWDKARELSTDNGRHSGTYMYDSSNRIFELAAKDPDYKTATDAYRAGFGAAVYDLHRCG